MINYNGVRTIGLISVVLGTATFGVCGWIFFTYEYGHPTSLLKNDTICFPKNASTTSIYIPFSSIYFSKSLQSPHLPLPLVCYKYLVQFLELIVWNSFIASVISLFQVGMSTYLLASNAQEAIKRAKHWTILNIAFNLIYLMCFTSTFTHPIPMHLGRRKAALVLSNVKYLSSYYLILGMDIFIGFIMLIAAMLMIRLDNKYGYGLVANV